MKMTTTLSTKGRVTLPETIRRALRWVAGTRLVVESTSDGVLLKPEPSLPETRPEDVFGSLAYDGKPAHRPVPRTRGDEPADAGHRHRRDRRSPHTRG